MNQFNHDIESAIKILHAGGIILYPTDTIWGIGCDATNEGAVRKIFELKKRADNKSMIVLVANASDIHGYVRNPPNNLQDILYSFTSPTTMIYEEGMHLASNALSIDGSVAIRIVADNFCRSLITSFGKPLVSTSANISGTNSPKNFQDVGEEIKNGVDYIVEHRQNDLTISAPSSIIKIGKDGKFYTIR